MFKKKMVCQWLKLTDQISESLLNFSGIADISTYTIFYLAMIIDNSCRLRRFRDFYFPNLLLSCQYTTMYNKMLHVSRQWHKPIFFSFNSLWPNDAIWRHRSGSTLAQVMACCLTAPSHYLNQCWLITSKIQLHSSDGNFTRNTSVVND